MASVLATTMPGEERIQIDGLSYEFYKQFCDAIGEQPIRLSYDSEILEIMITKSPHEYYKEMLAKLIEMTIFELNIPVRSGGSMTFQRDDLRKGLEPDKCWWIETEPLVRGKREFDFRHDPPPDLAVEIEISHSLGTRLRICAAIGIKEVWRCTGEKLQFLRLATNGRYEPSDVSLALPILRPEYLLPYMDIDDPRDETTRLRAFRDWLLPQIH